MMMQTKLAKLKLNENIGLVLTDHQYRVQWKKINFLISSFGQKPEQINQLW